MRQTAALPGVTVKAPAVIPRPVRQMTRPMWRQPRRWPAPLRARVAACTVICAALLVGQAVLPAGASAVPLAGEGASAAAGTTTPTVTTTADVVVPTSEPTTSNPTGAATATGTADWAAPSPRPAPPGDGEAPLSAEEVAVQVAQAERLRGALTEVDARLAVLGEQLAASSVKAAAALERARRAELAMQAAQQDLHQQLALLGRLRADTATSQGRMAQWARSAYAAGGTIATYEGWITVLQSDTVDDTSHDLAVLEHLGVLNGEEIERLTHAASQQTAVAEKAAAAARSAASAAAEATQAKKKADELLDEQRAVLARVQEQQLAAVGAAESARELLQRSTDPDALAAAALLSAALGKRRSGAPVPVDPDECRGLSTDGYANGQIPTAALCPLWGAPHQMLRGDAARAFGALSREYDRAFGEPICVTDSYRSRSAQVSLYATKPQLAARPGTSNHGWGTAVDLCGGIESFGTAHHVWLLSHAPLYGWFHPSWAEPSGSRPEPWHWEYAG